MRKAYLLGFLFSLLVIIIKYLMIGLGPSFLLSKYYDYPYMLVMNKISSFLIFNRFYAIFNIFLILGLSATVNSLIINFATLIDMLVMLAAGLLVYGFILKDQKVTRQRGIILLVFYFSYVCYLLVR